MTEARKINPTTTTFVLETCNGEPMANCQEFYPCLDTLGQHYLISSALKPSVFRQYTVCNAMNPEIYDGLVEALNAGSGKGFNYKMLQEKMDPSYRIRLCVKNYEDKGIVSSALHRDENF
jgi:hypothetical protein